MSHIVDYLIHDPIGNVEGQLGDYDPVRLEEAEKNGMVFIAVMDDGERRLVKPEYVDERTQATVAVFDALADIVNPQTAAVDENSSGEQPVVDPITAFENALNKLKSLQNGDQS